MSCAGFVFLTDCTSAHIVFGKFFHPFAFIGLTEEMGCVRDSWVSCKWVIVVQAKNFASLFELFGELSLGEMCGGEQHHVFIVILPLANTKGSGQEVGGDVMLAGDMLQFEVKFR